MIFRPGFFRTSRRALAIDAMEADLAIVLWL